MRACFSCWCSCHWACIRLDSQTFHLTAVEWTHMRIRTRLASRGRQRQRTQLQPPLMQIQRKISLRHDAGGGGNMYLP